MAGMEEVNEQGAVEVKGAHWSYGSLSVLKGLDMDVPYSCIYGLLGASGCGKTTLLHCILGRLQLSKGSMRVLGLPPGARGHTIPGRDVGYMPQDLALLGDFTMLETMYYFGIIWPVEGMPKFLRYISYALPTTHAAEAMRSIIGRGWGLGHLVVWRGFTITIGWFMLFDILAIIGLRLRK